MVVAGPLMGDWMTQTVLEWIDEGASLTAFEYSNRKAAFIGDILHSTGQVVAVDLKTGEVTLALQIRNAASEVIAPGEAVVQFSVG